MAKIVYAMMQSLDGCMDGVEPGHRPPYKVPAA